MMRKGLNLALVGILSGATFATTLPTEALAGPMSATRPDAVSVSTSVDKVWYRRGYGGGYYRRGNPGAAIAAGVGLGLLGAGLAASSGGYGYGYPYGGGYYGGGYGYYPSYYGGGYGGYPYYGGGYYGGGWGGGGWGW